MSPGKKRLYFESALTLKGVRGEKEAEAGSGTGTEKAKMRRLSWRLLL